MLKRLSNLSERRVYEEIVGAAEEYRAHIYRKVRIADVIDIDRLGTRAMGTYALQAHFDFCIADENEVPAFAIEFDGGGHTGRGDAMKDDLARAADLALFRIDERTLERSLCEVTFLQYLVHTHFLGQTFRQWQESGQLDPSEPFFMSGFLKPDAKNIFDSRFDFTGGPRGRINRRLVKAGVVDNPFPHLGMSGLILGRDDSSFVGFASVRVGARSAFAKARIDIGTPCLGGLGRVSFGWSALSDFCEGMLFEDLYDEIGIVLGGNHHVARDWETVEEEMLALHADGFSTLRGFFGSGGDDKLARYLFPQKAAR